MAAVKKALQTLTRVLAHEEARKPIPFAKFLQMITENPQRTLRCIYQLFYDMVHYYVPEGVNEYPNDPETINYIKYDTSRLFVEDSDNPFFADRLVANRFINHVEAMRQNVLQNRIYIIEGPPGTGKSTFLNELLRKLEIYTTLEEGAMYEIIWQINIAKLGGFSKISSTIIEEPPSSDNEDTQTTELVNLFPEDYLSVPCPSHDHPILMIPRQYRAEFLEDVFEDQEIVRSLQESKEYAWLWKWEPCAICKSLYDNLLSRLNSPAEVLKMIYVRRYIFNRQMGQGISVFSPSDPISHRPMRNTILQNLINNLLHDSNAVNYVHSRLAPTNNGIYAIMDLKGHNIERMNTLHGIISDRVHKVENVEEFINSIFITILNPEDNQHIANIQSFEDRIVRLRMPYILDYKTEIAIYRHFVGDEIDSIALPHVLEYFAKIIISTRMRPESDGMKQWISDPKKYRKICDENLLLLKMDIYTGYIPPWVTSEDLKAFDAPTRRKIIGEGEIEGDTGLSGRQSLQLFFDFYHRYRSQQPIQIENILNFFRHQPQNIQKLIPKGFFTALHNHYDYLILQEIKEALYNYNRERIDADIKNYLFALNFEPETKVKNPYTNEEVEITENFLRIVESFCCPDISNEKQRSIFRKETQKAFLIQKLAFTKTELQHQFTQLDIYQKLFTSYTNRLKEHVLDPLISNENFRMAIKEYGTKDFDTYDSRIKQDVELLFQNLQQKFGYTIPGAKIICVYALDRELPKKFG